MEDFWKGGKSPREEQELDMSSVPRGWPQSKWTDGPVLGLWTVRA
jgi:hypothetical protein